MPDRTSQRNSQRKRRRPAKMDDDYIVDAIAGKSETVPSKSTKKQVSTKKTNNVVAQKSVVAPVKKPRKPRKKSSKKKVATGGRARKEFDYARLLDPPKEPLEIADDMNFIVRTDEGAGVENKEKEETIMQIPAISQPFVYGSVAWWLGRKEQSHSHKWTVYVRGLDCEDLSYMLRKVVFNLHSSFNNPKRIVTQHPFEITEFGWGEFELKIQLYFVDSDEPPVEVFHHLRLYPPAGQAPSLKRPVVSEFYDEVVFNRPNEEFAKKLLKPIEDRKPTPPHPMKDIFADFSEQRDLKIVERALNYVENEARRIEKRIVEIQSSGSSVMSPPDK
jgi:YEATS domain-containing protein 4